MGKFQIFSIILYLTISCCESHHGFPIHINKYSCKEPPSAILSWRFWFRSLKEDAFYNSPSGLILNCFRYTHAQCKKENREVPSELSHFMYTIDRLLTSRQSPTPGKIQGNGQNITHLHIQLPLLHSESDVDYLIDYFTKVSTATINTPIKSYDRK